MTYELYVVPFSSPNSMSKRSRSQSSERMHVVSGPISVVCVCRRFVPSHMVMSELRTSLAGGSATALARVVVSTARRARAPRRVGASAGAVEASPRAERQEAAIACVCHARVTSRIVAVAHHGRILATCVRS